MGQAKLYDYDVKARFKFLNNFNVLHPIQMFGLPAENVSKLNNLHPRVDKPKHQNYEKSIKITSLSIDWSKEIST